MKPCRLCLQDKPLRRSHILPEFAYRPTYNAKHSAVLLDQGAGRRALKRQGYWEPLLCEDCEHFFERWEDYFAKVWFGDSIRPKSISPGWLSVNIDYARTKLLLLSIAWRAGVASIPAFADVRLGPHEDRIRDMLIAEDPGAESIYPLMTLGIRDPGTGGFKDSLVCVPVLDRINGHHVIRTLFGGIFWYSSLSRHSLKCPVSPTLKENGTMLINIDDWNKHGAILGLARAAKDVWK